MENLVKVGELTPRSRGVNLVAKIVSMTPVRTVKSQYDQSEHRLSEAIIADETGAITLVLWDEKIDQVREGEVIRIVNGFIRIFKGRMQLNLGRYGAIESSDQEIGEVNVENNLSERVFREGEPFQRSPGRPRYGRRGPRRL